MPGKVTSILGVRRAGKTTFVHQMRRERLAAGAARVLVPYVNFEDERLAGLQGTQLGFLLEEYGRRVPEVTRLGTPAFPRRRGSIRRRGGNCCATTWTWRSSVTWSSGTR